MFRWVPTLLVIAILAGVIGFADRAAGAVGITMVILSIFLVLLMAVLISGGPIRKKPG